MPEEEIKLAIYFLTFFSSFIFCAIAEENLKQNKKQIAVFFFVISVLIVSTLAGIRSYSIGTDITTYGNWMFYAARREANLITYLKGYPEIDLLYSVLTFFVARFTNSPHWLYFIVGLLIYGFTMNGLIKYNGQISICVAWLCFLFLFYGDTLNALRQSIAMAIVFWGFHFAIEKKYWKYFVVTGIALLFHNTAIISFGIFVIYCLLLKRDTIYTRVIIVTGTLLLLIVYGELLQLLINLGILNDRFTRYVSSGVGFQLNPFLLRLPILIIILIYYNRFSKAEYGSVKKLDDVSESSFLIILLIIEIITAQMRAILPALYRISFYFGYYKIVAYGRLQKILVRNERVFIGGILVAYLIVLWVYQNVIQGNNEIYPFMSDVLGIR